jgi:hypothetical protein
LWTVDSGSLARSDCGRSNNQTGALLGSTTLGKRIGFSPWNEGIVKNLEYLDVDLLFFTTEERVACQGIYSRSSLNIGQLTPSDHQGRSLCSFSAFYFILPEPMTTSISFPLSSQDSMKSILPSWRSPFPCNSPIPCFKIKGMCLHSASDITC